MKNSAVDDILLTLGSWGRYEKLQFLLLMLPLLPTALHIVSIVFIGRAAEHQCAPLPDSQNIYYNDTQKTIDFATESMRSIHQNNSANYVYKNLQQETNISSQATITYGKCRVETRNSSGHLLSSTSCPQGYQYGEPRHRTIVSEWDLVCERDAMSDLSQTIMGVGMSVGALSFPTLADKYGRKKTYIIAELMLFLTAGVTIFAPNFTIFAFFRFLTGVAQQGTSIVPYVLLLEQLPTTHRSLVIRLGMYIWPLCLLSMSLFAYLTREVSWRYTQLLLSACSLYFIVAFWFIDESVRWLMANNKLAEAEMVIRRAARISGVNLHKVMDVFRDRTHSMLVPVTPSREDDLQQLHQDTAPPEPTKENFFMALKNKQIFKITAISFYMWFADSATYYGLILTSGSLVNDLYLGYAVNILVELPAGVAFFFMCDRYTRRTCMIFFHLVAGIALLAVVALNTIQAAQSIPGINIIVVIISLIGKFGSSAGYGVLWMYTPELFPTNIRTTGFGVSSLAARIGVIVTPFSRTLGRHLPWAPGVIFGILCLLIPVLTVFLPEMHGRELPQTLADMKTLKKVKSGRTHNNERSQP